MYFFYLTCESQPVASQILSYIVALQKDKSTVSLNPHVFCNNLYTRIKSGFVFVCVCVCVCVRWMTL